MFGKHDNGELPPPSFPCPPPRASPSNSKARTLAPPSTISYTKKRIELSFLHSMIIIPSETQIEAYSDLPLLLDGKAEY